MKNLTFQNVAVFFFLLFTYNTLLAGTVSLDLTFNNSGYRIQNIDPDGSFGNSIAIQPDGKIVLGGWTLGPSVYDKFAAMRLNSDGTLDTTFSNDGYVTTAYSNFNQVEKLLLQPDGKMILGGTRYFGENDFAMIRYTTNGVPDMTFDGDGGAASQIDGISEDFGKDMALQDDGKIIMVGSTKRNSNTTTDIGIIRRNSNGSFDTNFNGNGKVLIRFQDVDSSATSVLIQNDGKIVIGGFLFTGVNNSLLLMRLHPNGFLDTSFGDNGLTITSVNGSNNTIRTLNQQSDGKILAGSLNQVFRYSPNGITDHSFGNNGTITAPQSVQEILVKKDDTFLVSGSASFSFAVSSFLPNGTTNTNFNNTGTVIATATGSNCFGFSLAIQSDNKIVVGGDCLISEKPNFAIFRFVETENNTNNKPIFDFDGDSKTEISFFRPSLGEWWYLRSSDLDNRALQFGNSSDIPVPADFTGDRKTDISFFRNGEWFILRSEDSSFFSFPFGTTGDIPAPGDFDGDGIADATVFRPSSGTWFVLKTTGGTDIIPFGIAEDKPVVADYDGDGKDDIGIFRPSNSQWWINRSRDGLAVLQFGQNGDKTVPGDYTGDGKADIAFFRPSLGEWFIIRSEDNSFFSFPFGANEDIAAPGDYDGDGVMDTAVFRPSQTTWYLNTTSSGVQIVGFGLNGDIPVPSVFNRP